VLPVLAGQATLACRVAGGNQALSLDQALDISTRLSTSPSEEPFPDPNQSGRGLLPQMSLVSMP
jgi:hypothetical protein